MGKEFAYFGVIHSEPSFETLKSVLKREVKPGQSVAYEITPKGLRELSPYLDLIRKAKSAKITVEEKAKLQTFFSISKRTPDIAFSAKLVFLLESMGCKIIPLGSRTVNSAMKRVDAKIAQVKNHQGKEVAELVEKQEKLVAIKEESAFRKRVLKFNPDAVIVGAKHHGAFVGLPHRVVLDELQFARGFIGKKLDVSMHQRALARSAMRQRRVNRLINRKRILKRLKK